MRKLKKWAYTALVSLLVLTSTESVISADNGMTTDTNKVTGGRSSQMITILHTNDIHSRVEESTDSIGYAKLSTLLKQTKAVNPNTLMIDAGDTFHGQTISNLVRGESIVKIMNLIGYDVMTAGNHDFNYGSARLVELAKQANFPILGANVKKTDGSRLLGTNLIKEVNGVKIGIFGLTTPETAYKTHPNNVEGITFADPVQEAKAQVAELRSKVDIIIAISHLGVDATSIDTSKKVAEQVPGIDVIIDGHSHTVMEKGMMVGSVLIAQTGEYGKNIGKIQLNIENGKLSSKNASLITRKEADQFQADPAVLDVINNVKKEQETVLSQVVGTTSDKLIGDRTIVRKGESNLGNLITNAMLSETGADVAITNGGGIRASIEAGQITKGDIITVLPFGNYIQTKKVKGSDIKAALELGVSGYPGELGGFPHVGGIFFEFDPAQPVGNRVLSILIKGKQLDPNQMYLLATNDFMAAGGDQYTMFKDYPIANDFSSLEESVITYMQTIGSAVPKIEGRITVKGANASNITDTAATPSAPSVTAPALTNTSKVYMVKTDDTLWKIAGLYATTWQTLQKLNSLTNPDRIYPGQEILLP
ncbi:5'-nucleotidase C-terminal domain-containing protein [Paenibacillus sp. WQ 127069]|uniref:5'-nucleotidase C-terminal domain-containing protein n=1 Tax=Paenibacillus baimaensis TaxID=2982185 RepID=A0ABT2U9N6_9BACL|nr:5'-nucleotidase C-terminal domain-containing protein [Paenibacillus sp. WQ 127069]MCU6790896.1 5'-nucleotidase C-terminal domain-containing protein [Paenibacillus sp. WQ 127069]